MPEQRDDILIPVFLDDFLRLSIDERVEMGVLRALCLGWLCEPNINIESKLMTSMYVVLRRHAVVTYRQ